MYLTQKTIEIIKAALRVKIPDKDMNILFECATPTIIYSEEILRSHLSNLVLKVKQIENVELYYSVKANANDKLLRIINEYVSGFEVASEYELDIVNKVSGKKVICTSPALSRRLIEQLYDKGSVFDFNSITSIERYRNIIKSKKIGLRIRIDKKQLGEKYECSRFGVDVSAKQEIYQLEKIVENNNFKITQIHCHCSISDPNDQETMFEYIKSLLSQQLIFENVSSVSIGGGQPFLYASNNTELRFWRSLEKFAKEMKKSGIKVIMEPGESIVSSCGFLVVTVIDVQILEKRQYVTVDSSAFNLLSWQGTCPCSVNATPLNKTHKEYFTTIYGKTCYEGDLFAKNIMFPKLCVGDRIVFYPVGAYVVSIARQLHYIPVPKEIIV